MENNLIPYVLAGFKSVSKLWDFATPELLNDEINNIAKAILPHIKNNSAQDFAFIAGRNRANELLTRFNNIDCLEKLKRNKLKAKKEKKLAEQEKLKLTESGKEELALVLETLLQSDLNNVKKQSLDYFKLIYVDGLKDPQIADQFPGTSRDQRYQWKTRAIQLILPHISEEAKKYISFRTKTKFAEILHLANQFYKLAKTRADKEGVELPSASHVLKQYITDSAPYNYLRLQGIQTGQVGINPQQKWGTPVGICAYPLTSERYNKSISQRHEFAGQHPNTYIFTAKNPSKILYLNQVNLADEIAKLKQIYNHDIDLLEKLIKKSHSEAHQNNEASKLFYITRALADYNTIKWTKLFITLGYEGLHDPGLGIIYESEPTQAIFFSGSFIKELDLIDTKNISKKLPNKDLIDFKLNNKINPKNNSGIDAFLIKEMSLSKSNSMFEDEIDYDSNYFDKINLENFSKINEKFNSSFLMKLIKILKDLDLIDYFKLYYSHMNTDKAIDMLANSESRFNQILKKYQK